MRSRAFHIRLAAYMLCLIMLLPAPVRGEGASGGDTLGFYRVMTSNKGVCLPVGGVYRDWIELVNFSDRAVDLDGWSIIRNADFRKRYVFTERVLAPMESIVLYGGKPVEGAPSGTLFLGFNLSAGGVQLTLQEPRGELVETLSVPALSSGSVYTLDALTGAWSARDPYDAFDLGVSLLPGAAQDEADLGVRLNELMAANHVTLRDDTGAYTDWVELYNYSHEDIRLAGWSMTDDTLAPRKFVFPDVTLPAYDYLIVFLTGHKQLEGTLHAPFRLSAAGDQLLLFDPQGTVASRMSYETLGADCSLARQADGTLAEVDTPSPGYENTLEGTLMALDADWKGPAENALGLYINEVMVSMDGGSDWCELVNLSANDIDLSGYGLSPDPDKPRRWQFPQGVVIKAGQFMGVKLAGAGADPARQADFALSVDKFERLVLSDPSGAPIDRMALFNQRRGVSYGRVEGSDQYGYFTTPTPGKPNIGTSYPRAAQDVSFSEPGGLRDEPFSLMLSGTPGIPIYYTLDGSAPDLTSTPYTQPIQITGTTVVRAIAWADGALTSGTTTQTYLFDEDPGIKLVCVSGDPEELTGENGTLVTSKAGSGYSVHVEIYDRDMSRMISQECLFKLHGSGSRSMFPQKAFRLTAKKEYGDNRFRAALFNDLAFEEYKAVILRCGGQDNQSAFMRDAVLSTLAQNTSVLYMDYEPAIVYVNGEYWGFYFMRERINAQMICQHEGWSNDDQEYLDILKGSEPLTMQGSSQAWKELMSFAKKNDLRDEGNLATLRTYMDVENYLEYVMLEMYTDNQDLGNVISYRDPNGDGLWRWAFFDLDLSFRAERDPVKGWLSTSSDKVGSITTQPNVLFKALMKNDGCREYFLTRYGELLRTDLSADNVIDRIDYFHDIMAPHMQRNCARWGWSYEKWENAVENMRGYARKATDHVIDSLIEDFKLSDAEAQRYFG